MESISDNPPKSFIYDKFGSKTGFLRYLYFQSAMMFGCYDRYFHKEVENIHRLVFVCMGNICRSPLAEAYARDLGFAAESCGLACKSGYPADSRAIEYGASIGVSLDEHRTRNINEFDFRKGDLVLGMEPAHVAALQELHIPDVKIALTGLWRSRRIAYIHDPFNCSEQYFNQCESMIVESVRGLLAQKETAS